MESGTPKQLAADLHKRFNCLSQTETLARIVTIWLVGTMQQLANLGVISGGEMEELDGLDQWNEIDKHRRKLIPPIVLHQCLEKFVKIAAVENLQNKLKQVITMYYTNAGRLEIVAESFDRIFLNSPSKRNEGEQ